MCPICRQPIDKLIERIFYAGESSENLNTICSSDSSESESEA